MLRITPVDYYLIRRHGQEAYPYECCGILAGSFGGDGRTVYLVLRCSNAAKSQRTSYEIDPRELIRAQRQARERGFDIVGFYHSHPDHPPQWSPTDLAEAHWIGCSYLIVTVENGKAAETRSFMLTGRLEEDKRFVREDLLIDEGAR